MKKHITMLTILLCACCLLYSCSNFTANETPSPDTSPTPLLDTSPTPEASPRPTTDSGPTVTIHPVYGELPVYQPGSIELITRGSDYYYFIRQYRVVYYGIEGTFWELLSEEEEEDFHNWVVRYTDESNYGEFLDEMLLVTFIKRYNFTREQFDLAVEEYLRQFEGEVSHEEFEPPNGDIIYTFDNEIINEYYRYE